MEKIFLGSILYSADNIQPGFSVDCVILSFHKKKVHVLLSKFDASPLWKLPGGFMLKEENADDAAYRVLYMRTKLTNVYMRQFYLFSDVNRTNLKQNEILAPIDLKKEWLTKRFVTLGYYALVRYDDVKIAQVEGEENKWHDIELLPPLYADHEYIITKAKEMIQVFSHFMPIAEQLLPEKFTLSELRKVYEIILNKAYDRRNFQRKILSSGIVVQLDETKTKSTYNPAALYSFSKKVKDKIESGTLL